MGRLLLKRSRSTLPWVLSFSLILWFIVESSLNNIYGPHRNFRLVSLNRDGVHSLFNVISSLVNYQLSLFIFKGKPTRERYIVVLDAGSTGSRIHIFKFSKGFYSEDGFIHGPESVNEVLYHVKPSISSVFLRNWKTRGTGAILSAANSIEPLLMKAVKEVPAILSSQTQIIVKGTAGMRLMDSKLSGVSDKIMKAIEHNLRTQWPFYLPRTTKNWANVSVLSSKDEGTYSWLALNWVTNNFQQGRRLGTSAVIDLGGASTQFVSEIPKNRIVSSFDSSVEEFDFGGQVYYLLHKSNDLYGLVAARKKLLMSIKQPFKSADQSNEKTKIPCYVGDRYYLINDHITGEKYFIWGENKDFEECKSIINALMFNRLRCSRDYPIYEKISNSLIDHETSGTALNEMISIEDQYSSSGCNFRGLDTSHDFMSVQSSPIYALSFIFDNFVKVHMDPVMFTLTKNDMANPEDKDNFIYEFTLKEMEAVASKLCSTSDYLTCKHKSTAFNEKMMYQCFDVSYMYSLIKNGYGIDENKKITSVKILNGLEVGWPLGIALKAIAS